MNDAYTIGITLALDDEVSAGLAIIRADLANLNSALGQSIAGLAALRKAAGPALAAFGGIAMPQASGRGNAAGAPEPQLPDLTRLFAAAPREDDAIGAPLAAAPRDDTISDAFPPAAPIIPSIPAMAPRNDGFEHAPHAPAPLTEGARPIAPILTPSISVVPEDGFRENPEPAQGLGVSDLLDLTRGLRPIAPQAETVSENTLQEGSAPSPLPFSAPASAPSAAGEIMVPAAVRGMPSAPHSRVSNAAPASPLLAGSAAAPRGVNSDQSSATLQIHGDVLLDGTRVGQWFGEQLAASASRPPSGYSGVDTRLGPLWPGAPVVP